MGWVADAGRGLAAGIGMVAPAGVGWQKPAVVVAAAVAAVVG